MEKKRVVVTGGSGKAGQWIIKEFLAHDYEVVNLDRVQSKESLCTTIIVDLTDLGQVTNALSMYATRDQHPIDGVVHFAAIPVAYSHPNDVTFRNNVMSTYNVLEACANLGITKVALASSESSYGIVFAADFFQPNYLPIDEAHPQFSEDSYGLSKMVNEITGEAFHRRTGMQVISFRLGNILVPEDYADVQKTFDHPEERLRILWSYIDARDVASACRLAIEKDGLGAQTLILAADDTSSNKKSKQLMQQFLPDVKEIRSALDGRDSFLSNEKLKKMLGWNQQYYIMNQVE